MKKIPRLLYIETETPTHNAELHTGFIKSIHDEGLANIASLGAPFLKKIFPNYRYLNKRIDIYTQIDGAIKDFSIDGILTYNKNGSWYGVKDNISLYRWMDEALFKTNIPKFHVTTDYCREGFVGEQSTWFKELGYCASIFRHKVSMSHPCSVDKYWLPFSVDAKKYRNLSKRLHSSRNPRVSFAGTAFQFPELYRKRIVAMNALSSAGLLSTPRVVDKKTGRLQMITGPGYQRFLARHKFGLACGGTCDFMTAKYFQIPAAGSILVCAKTSGIEIFPDDSYILFDEEDTDKLISDIAYFNKNKKHAAEIAKKLSKFVLLRHNNRVRAEEAVKIFSNYI